jgi:DNA-binding NarL/FixJ family response regulator
MEGIRILLIDDHPLFVEGLRHIIESEEDMHCVGVACNGEAAAALSEELVPDVALIDVSMAGMNGIETARLIKRKWPKIAILMVSAYKYEHYVLASIRSGASGYLLKETMPDKLIAAIRTVHGEINKHGTYDDVTPLLRQATGTNNKRGGINNTLHDRELQILELAARGYTNKRIAEQLGLSIHTVASHCVNLFRKLDVHSRTEAIYRAIREGHLV